MQIRDLVVCLFLAATVTAAPFEQKDSEWPSIENPFDDIGNNAQNNSAVGNDVGNNNGNDSGNKNGNGNENEIGSNNHIDDDKKFLNNFTNINYGATSRQISKEVVAAVMKSLTLTCNPIGEGVMYCTWNG